MASLQTAVDSRLPQEKQRKQQRIQQLSQALDGSGVTQVCHPAPIALRGDTVQLSRQDHVYNIQAPQLLDVWVSKAKSCGDHTYLSIYCMAAAAAYMLYLSFGNCNCQGAGDNQLHLLTTLHVAPDWHAITCRQLISVCHG